MTGNSTITAEAPLQQRELLLWLFWLGVIMIVLRYFNIGNAEQFWHHFGRINVFLVGALSVAGYRLYRYAEKPVVQRRDLFLAFMLVGGLILAALLPRLIGIGIYFLCLAVWMSRIEDRSRELFSCSVVLFAVTTHVLFAPIIFRTFLPFFVWLDAQFVGHLLQYLIADYKWDGTHFTRELESGRFGIVLAGACSSFNAVSAAVMIHIAWAMALRKRLTKWDCIALIATLVIATALNVARLVLSAMGPDEYAFWHGNGADILPTGAMIFIIVQNLAFVAAGYVTARWAGPSDP